MHVIRDNSSRPNVLCSLQSRLHRPPCNLFSVSNSGSFISRPWLCVPSYVHTKPKMFFSCKFSCNLELWPNILTIELDLHLGVLACQISRLKVISIEIYCPTRKTNTLPTDCSIWTTKWSVKHSKRNRWRLKIYGRLNNRETGRNTMRFDAGGSLA